MEKLEDRKDFNFSHFYLVESEKVEGRKKKVSLYKFTHTTLLKNDGQLKQKSDKKKKKKKRSLNLLKKKIISGFFKKKATSKKGKGKKKEKKNKQHAQESTK